MKKSWRDYVSDHGTIEGARAAFEKDCESLLQAMRPGEPVKVVRANPGDEGIDIYIGNIEAGPIEVYQCKFFLGPIGESQRGQIRESYKTALKSTSFKMSKWYLCMPSDDFDLEESAWWDGWVARQDSKSGIPITLYNGSRLINLFKEKDLYNTVFKIIDSLILRRIEKGVEYLVTKHEVPNNITNNEKLATIESIVNGPLFAVLFDVSYQLAYEQFYVERRADAYFKAVLGTPKNIWISGGSSCGKTILCRRNLSISNYSFVYCYLNKVPAPTSVEELLSIIFENILNQYEEQLPSFTIDGANWVKNIVKLLRKITNNGAIIISVDELSITNEVVLNDFIASIYNICAEYSHSSSIQAKLKFIVSTIKEPKSFCSLTNKMSEVFAFIDIDSWSKEELLILLQKIDRSLGAVLSEENGKIAIDRSENPRVLKEIIYEYSIHHKHSSFREVLDRVLAKS